METSPNNSAERTLSESTATSTAASTATSTSAALSDSNKAVLQSRSRRSNIALSDRARTANAKLSDSKTKAKSTGISDRKIQLHTTAATSTAATSTAASSTAATSTAASKSSTLRDKFETLRDRANSNVARNVASVFNGNSLSDLGWALAGALTAELIPPAVTAASQRNINLSVGVEGALVGTGVTTLVGTLSGNVPFMAGGLAVLAAKALRVLADQSVVEPLFGVRLNQWHPDVSKAPVSTTTTTINDGIYDNQPHPQHLTINGQNATVYDETAMLEQAHNGQMLKEKHARGESVNGISDGDIQMMRDDKGNHYLSDGAGGFLLCDADANLVTVPGTHNTYVRVIPEEKRVEYVDGDGNPVAAPEHAHAPHQKPEHHSTPEPQQSINDTGLRLAVTNTQPAAPQHASQHTTLKVQSKPNPVQRHLQQKKLPVAIAI